MVAETRESMTRMFDCMADGFRTACETGRRTQEAWLKAAGDIWSQRPGDGERLFNRGERMFREWVPFVGKSMETFTQACDATMRSSGDAFKAACEVAAAPTETNPYEASRQVWDAAFGALRTGFDAFGKAGVKTMENCSVFCDAILREETPRSPAAPPKGGKVGG